MKVARIDASQKELTTGQFKSVEPLARLSEEQFSWNRFRSNAIRAVPA